MLGVWYAAVLISRAAAIAPCSALQHLSTTAARANASLQEETPSERRSRFVGVFQRFRARSPTTNRTLASGAGSTLAYTNRTRHTLETVLRAHGIRSLLDVPCGDFAWMPHLLARHPELRYFGGDLVEELVDEHRARFARLPQWSFGVVDMAVGLPAELYDLVLTRDALQHLSPGDVLRVIRTVNATRCALRLPPDDLSIAP